MSFRFSKLAVTAHTRMTSAVVGVSLAAVGSAIYLSPAGTHAIHSKPDAAAQKAIQTSQAAGTIAPTDGFTSPTGTPSSSTPPKPSKTPTPTHGGGSTPAYQGGGGGGGGGGGTPTVIHAPGKTDVVV